jgi:hypothetical protein
MNLVSIWVDFVFFISYYIEPVAPVGLIKKADIFRLQSAQPAQRAKPAKPGFLLGLTLHLLSDIFHKHQKCQLFFK